MHSKLLTRNLCFRLMLLLTLAGGTIVVLPQFSTDNNSTLSSSTASRQLLSVQLGIW